MDRISNNAQWIYAHDEKDRARYTLGIRGQRPLICIGVNPSTARPHQLDSTLRSVDRLARGNGFDGWIMLNLYPQRTTDPNGLHLRMQHALHQENLRWIRRVMPKDGATIWAAWGTLIEKRPYLKRCLKDILELTNGPGCRWVCMGNRSKKGHPHHPLYLSSDEKPRPFDHSEYLNSL